MGESAAVAVVHDPRGPPCVGVGRADLARLGRVAEETLGRADGPSELLGARAGGRRRRRGRAGALVVASWGRGRVTDTLATVAHGAESDPVVVGGCLIPRVPVPSPQSYPCSDPTSRSPA